MNGRRLLRRFLKESGLSIADLSRGTGLDDGYLSKLINGTKRRAGLKAGSVIEQFTGGKVPLNSWLS